MSRRCLSAVYGRDISNNSVAKDESRWVVEAKVNGFSLEGFKVNQSITQRFPNASLQPHKYILPDRESRLQLVDMMRLIIGEFYSHQSRTQPGAWLATQRTLLKEWLAQRPNTLALLWIDQSERVHQGLRTVDFGRRVDKEMLMGCVDSRTRDYFNGW